jgi:hypothetical protein
VTGTIGKDCHYTNHFVAMVGFALLGILTLACIGVIFILKETTDAWLGYK